MYYWPGNDLVTTYRSKQLVSERAFLFNSIWGIDRVTSAMNYVFYDDVLSTISRHLYPGKYGTSPVAVVLKIRLAFHFCLATALHKRGNRVAKSAQVAVNNVESITESMPRLMEILRKKKKKIIKLPISSIRIYSRHSCFSRLKISRIKHPVSRAFGD